ncbi:hypothetical protein MNV49_002820 [Pseudohyphozyma bogoriensis]|nr:hypothetical protein MNV49_002820 [Pseudohyphozyma bogoriensis]
MLSSLLDLARELITPPAPTLTRLPPDPSRTKPCVICYRDVIINSSEYFILPSGSVWDGDCLRERFRLAIRDETMFPACDENAQILADVYLYHSLPYAEDVSMQRGLVLSKPRRSKEVSPTCAVCFEPLSDEPGSSVVLSSGQTWDVECVRRRFLLCLTDETMYPPRDTARVRISVDLAVLHFTPEELEAYSKKQREYAVPANRRLYCSHFATCGEFVGEKSKKGAKRKKVECEECGESTCSRCTKPWHDVDGLCDGEADNVVAAALVKSFAWKKCPKCSAVVERRDGCKHMVCRCNCQFCACCGQEYFGTCPCPGN